MKTGFRKSLTALLGSALLAGFLVYIRSVNAQQGPAPLGFELLAAGRSAERIRLNEKAPSDVLQTKLVFQPGADTGWHTHPGPVIVVVKTGAVTEFHSNGCVSVHPAGSVFFEEPGEVHRAVNQTGQVGEAYATFILPPGTQPLEPATAPGTRMCPSSNERQDSK
jgi:quercetin dioxygenase-like cupin family protein